MDSQEPGLENRIVYKANKYKDIDKLVESISTKRYPRTKFKGFLSIL